MNQALLDKIESEQFRKEPAKFNVGDSVKVHTKVVEGDKDQFQDTRHGSTIFKATTQIPPDHKAFVRLQSTGGLIADHYAPLSPDPAYHLEEESTGTKLRKKAVKLIMGIREGETDALDCQGLWPMFDELMSVAASGGTIDTAVKAATVEMVVIQ